MKKEKTTQLEAENRKRYTRPEITVELELETRAGSTPLGMPDPSDLSSVNE